MFVFHIISIFVDHIVMYLKLIILKIQIKMRERISIYQVSHSFKEISISHLYYPTSTRRHGNFAGVHTLLRILLSSNSAVLINIITGVSPPHFDFFVYYVLCQC
jgi:hypothetical protein